MENRQAGLSATKALVGRNFRLMPGGHLFPMEFPVLTAQAVRDMVCDLVGNALALCEAASPA
jgi:hypothetical protein